MRQVVSKSPSEAERESEQRAQHDGESVRGREKAKAEMLESGVQNIDQ